MTSKERIQAAWEGRPADRFILHPVDALFPDTPWEGVKNLIEIWKQYR